MILIEILLKSLLVSIIGCISSSVSALPIKKRYSQNSQISIPLSNYNDTIYANLNIGTPSQEINVKLDTTSSEFWIPDKSAAQYKVLLPSSVSTKFNSSTSQTLSNYNNDDDGFYYAYDNTWVAAGKYIKDTVSLDGAKLSKVTMGLANETIEGVGSLGIGAIGCSYSGAEYLHKNSFCYQSLPQLLKSKEFIESASYTLNLPKNSSESGSLVFGGKDVSKLSEYSSVDTNITNIDGSMAINFDGLYLVDSYLVAKNFTALIDINKKYTSIPELAFQNIISDYHVVNYDGEKLLGFDCNSMDENESFYLSFQIGNQAIEYPKESFMSSFTTNDRENCYLTIAQSKDNNWVLGSSFLSSQVVYVDLDSNTISLAPNSETSDHLKSNKVPTSY